MICEKIRNSLEDIEDCSITEMGARVKTQCLYPSFEPVHVYVVGFGDGYLVHDGGNTNSLAWMHGRDGRAVTSALKSAADRYSIAYQDGMLSTKIESLDWLRNAILAVSNAAALGAHDVVSKVSKIVEIDLKERMNEVLERSIDLRKIAREYAYIGNSGREYHFDFAIVDKGHQLALIDGVVPHSASIYAKFTAFSDVTRAVPLNKFVVYASPLQEQDKTLLQQVADVVPFNSFQPGLERAFGNVH